MRIEVRWTAVAMLILGFWIRAGLVIVLVLALSYIEIYPLRALRILRVLRVISVAPRLRRVVEGFVTALPGMGSVFLLMAIIFYIGAVMSTNFFGERFPEWFCDIAKSMYTLFQVMTLESWSMGIVRRVMEQHPGAWAFFVPFIVVTTFTVLNLFIALIVNSMQSLQATSASPRSRATGAEVSHCRRARATSSRRSGWRRPRQRAWGSRARISSNPDSRSRSAPGSPGPGTWRS